MKKNHMRHQRARPTTVKSSEGGFGIIEVIVAMTLIAIILMALAPFLISSFQTSARHIRIAGATTEVDSRIGDVLRSQTCAELVELTSPASEVLPSNQRKVEYRVLQSAYDAGQTPITVDRCRQLASVSGLANYYYVVEVHDQARFDEDKPLAVGRTWVTVKE